MPARRTHRGNQEKVDVTDRWAEALTLRRGGATYEQIAKAVGYADTSGAYKAVMKALRETLAEPAEELRTLELQRLDRLFLEAWKLSTAEATNPELRLKSIDRCQRLSESRRKLLGLDAALPVYGSLEEVDVAALAAQLGAEYPDLESSAVLAEVEQIMREAQRQP